MHVQSLTVVLTSPSCPSHQLLTYAELQMMDPKAAINTMIASLIVSMDL